MKLSYFRFKSFSNILAGTVAIVGIAISQSPIVNVSAIAAPQPLASTPTVPADIQEVTVRIEIRDSDGVYQNGSGVIVSKNQNTYTVLTVDHNFWVEKQSIFVFDDKYKPEKEKKVFIVTYKGEEIELTKDRLRRLRNDNKTELDLALVTFSSQEEYKPAILAPLSEELDPMSVYGRPAALRPNSRYSQGTINSRGATDYQGEKNNGYVLIYDAWTAPGMSGGPVFDDQGRVIGIHGIKPPLELPNISSIFSLSQRTIGGNAAIPINAFTEQIPPSELGNKVNPYFVQIPEFLISDLKAGLQIQPTRVTINPLNSLYRQGLANLYHAKFSEAINNFQSVVGKDPNYAPAYINMGIAYYHSNKLTEATGAFNNALTALEKLEDDLRIDPALQELRLRAFAHLALAAIYLQNANATESLKEHELAAGYILEAEKRALFYIDRANILIAISPTKKKDLNEALKNAENLAKEKKDAWGYVSLGIFYQNMQTHGEEGFVKNLKQPDEMWQKAIKIDPKNYQVYLEIGKYLIQRDPDKQQSRQKALDFWKELVKAVPDSSLALRELSDKYEQFGYLKEALDSINSAIEKEDDNPEIYMERGQKLVQTGNTQQAIDDFKKAQALFESLGNYIGVERAGRQICRISRTDCPPITAVIPPPNNGQSSGQNTGTTDPKPTNQGSSSVATGTTSITQTFYCDPTSGRVTVDRTQNGDRPLITWVSNRFTPWGYDPRLRCQQVSARLQEYRASGDLDLNRITYGRMNDRTVLCVARPERILQRSATRCRGGRLILTLEPRQNPEQVVREFKQVLTGTYPNPPLRKELSNPASKE